MRFKPTFVAQDFISGQQVQFTIYDDNFNIIESRIGQEWANTGVYFIDVRLRFRRTRTYLVVAEEMNGSWKSAKLIRRLDRV